MSDITDSEQREYENICIVSETNVHVFKHIKIYFISTMIVAGIIYSAIFISALKILKEYLQ